MSPITHIVHGAINKFRNRLIRGVIGSAVAQAIGRLLALAVTIVLARGLGTNGYGLYTYAFTLLSFLTIITGFGMPTLLVREIAASNANHSWSCLRGVLVRSHQFVIATSLIAVLCVGFILWILADVLSKPQLETCVLVTLILPIAVFSKTMIAALRGLGHVVKAQFVELVFPRVALILLTVAFFVYSPSTRLPQYAVGFRLIIGLGVLCIIAIILYRCLPKAIYSVRSQFKNRRWIVSAFPLMLIGSAGIINNQTDILMLGIFRTADDVGVYRVAVQVSALTAFGLTAVNAVIAPQFSSLFTLDKLEQLQQLVTKGARVISMTAFLFAITLFFAGEQLIELLFGHVYVQGYTVMLILVAGQLVSSVAGSVGFLLNMTGHEKDVAMTLVITACLNIILNLFLIPRFGINGAACSTATSLAIWNIMLCLIAKRRLGVNSTVFVINKKEAPHD